MTKKSYTFDFFFQAFQNARQTAKELFDDADDTFLFTPPAEGKWSAIQILNHLNRAGEQYLWQIQPALRKPKEELPEGNGVFTHNFMFEWFIRRISPQKPSYLPTVKPFEPGENSKLDPEIVLDEFMHLQQEFLSLLDEAKNDNADLAAIKVSNPVVKFVKMPVSACFALTDAHQRRHFDQIRHIKDQMGS